MAWQEQLKTDLVVITGDGKVYTPDYLNANQTTPFNIAEFVFKRVQGTLVRRGTIRGARYNIEWYFQGADYLEVTAEFKESSKNNNAWEITHPVYGRMLCHPVTITYDDSKQNCTKITGEIVETISSQKLNPLVSVPDLIIAEKITTDTALLDSYVTDVNPVAVADQIQMQEDTGTIFTTISGLIENITTEYQDFVNQYNAANRAIDTAIANASGAIGAAQSLISLPYVWLNTVQQRLEYLQAALAGLVAGIAGLTTPGYKRLFECYCGTIITAMCATTVTNIGTDYRNRNDVLKVVDLIIAAYNGYIINLDSLQTDTGALPTSYIPEWESQSRINRLVNFTVSNLFAVASNSRQQRTVLLQNDTNAILLAFQFYGMLPDDSTIEQVINDNNIVGDELLYIRAGRNIVYYV